MNLKAFLSLILRLLPVSPMIGCAQSYGDHGSVGPKDDILYSILIAGGTVVDGTGAEGYRADVLIVDDTISYIGNVDSSKVLFDNFIDASERFVTPGFIDPHGHGDPLNSGAFTNFLAMGVTTVILGQDGSSPINQAGFGPGEYLKKIEESSPLINIGMMAGHGSLRRQIGVPDSRPARAGERSEMQTVLSENLKAGCFGMSSGLEYVPGMYADSMEMDALAQVIGEHDGVLMSHLRSEDEDKINKALQELAYNNKHCRTHVSHIKVIFGQEEEKASRIMAYLEEVSTIESAMTAEVYPYTASFTGIGIVFPTWAKTPTAFETARKTREPELRQFLQEKVEQRNGPEATLFGTGPFAGRTLAQVASASGRSFVDVLMQLGPFGASGAYFVMDQELQDQFIAHPEVVICSDGSPTMRHPRGYGSFSRVIEKYVVDRSDLTLESAIHKMSGRTAEILKVVDRGILRPGYYADILVFDPMLIREHATWTEPHELSSGFETIVINGQLAFTARDKTYTGFGRLIRPQRDQ